MLWLSQFYLYVLAGVTSVAVILAGLLYITNLKLGKARAERDQVVMALDVSNDSVKSLTTELQNISVKLKAAEDQEKKTQQDIADRLKQQDKKDKTLVDLEKKLKTRPTTLHCTIPKDLLDAWNKL